MFPYKMGNKNLIFEEFKLKKIYIFENDIKHIIIFKFLLAMSIPDIIL